MIRRILIFPCGQITSDDIVQETNETIGHEEMDSKKINVYPFIILLKHMFPV